MTDTARRPTRTEKVALVSEYLRTHPHYCAAPVGRPRANCLERDPILGVNYHVVPFGDLDETGWSLWFFTSAARCKTFVRRYRDARFVKSPVLVTRRRPR